MTSKSDNGSPALRRRYKKINLCGVNLRIFLPITIVSARLSKNPVLFQQKMRMAAVMAAINEAGYAREM